MVELTNSLRVTLDLDLDDLLKASVFQGEDIYGEPVYSSPLAGQIIKLAAEKLAADLVNTEIKDAVRDLVRERVADLVDQTLTEPVQLTDNYGRAKGEPKSIRDLLTTEAQEAIKQWVKGLESNSYGSIEGGYKKYLRDVVDRAVKADLDGALKAAREGVLARVQARAAELVAMAAAKAAGI